VTGYWAPARADIEALESQLSQLASQVAEPSLSNRQYVGFESKSKRLIYINAFPLPDHSDIDPAREAIRVCDGGKQFWGAVYDPQSSTFSDVQFNGPPPTP